MAEEAVAGRAWGYIATEVAKEFGLRTGRSPTLTDVINFGARYVDTTTDLLVFDSKALTLGLIAAGAPDSSRLRYGSAASWFREWLGARCNPGRISEALTRNATPIELVEKRAAGKSRVALSVSVRDVAKRAAAIAMATVGRPSFEARHVLAAMIDKGTVADQMKLLLRLSVAESDVDELKRFLIDEIVKNPEEGETREKWLSALSLAPLLERGKKQVQTAPSPEVRPAQLPLDGIVPFSRDSVDGGGNLLGTQQDVDGLAELICLKGSTPLALAVFGGWGSGKSTFMAALDRKVEEIAADGARAASRGRDTPFVSRIVQLRFNAWQFVDANLWASLTAEFFDQLRAGGWQRAGTVRHAGLVERVNSHVHALSSEAAARRAAAVASSREVIEAQEARDVAAKEASEAEGKAVRQATVDTLGDLYQSQKSNLRALGLATGGDDPAPAIGAVVEAVRHSMTIAGQARTVVRLLRRRKAEAALLATAFVAAAAGTAWLFLRGGGPGLVLAGFAAVSALGAFARALLPALKLVRSAAKRAGDIAQSVEAADGAALKRLLEKEVTLRDITAEAEALTKAAARADHALARYIDPTGASNPPRLLRYVLEDDPDAKTFEKEIGLIGRARRVFQAVDDIIRQHTSKAGDEGREEVPERIILYIDDLDRCTEKQVYDVLQAIHLLLAFESFAVVVGVDVRWIESALAREFATQKLPELTDLDRRQHAVQYLEKIFQVAFWLDGLSAGGDDGGTYARFVKDLAKPAPSTASAPRETGRREEAVAGSGGGASGQRDGDDPTQRDATAALGASPGAGSAATDDVLETPRTIELEQAEVDFLASPELAALAGRTPRAVKRLVNVYRLVRSRLVQSGGLPMGSEASPCDYPLAAIAVAIETGQSVEVAGAFLKAVSALQAHEEILSPTSDTSRQLGAPERVLSHTFVGAFFGRFDDEEPIPIDDKAGRYVFAKCPALQPAMIAAYELRKGRLTAGDMLRVATLARRYSFNRYH